MKYTKEQQLENLRKLADFLMTVPDNKFDMWAFESECGTVACACGYGPKVGIKKLDLEDWIDYSERVFGVYEFEDLEWSWCFSPLWIKGDNTPKGAAKRINFLLDNGLPEDWESQMHGHATLCYV